MPQPELHIAEGQVHAGAGGGEGVAGAGRLDLQPTDIEAPADGLRREGVCTGDVEIDVGRCRLVAGQDQRAVADQAAEAHCARPCAIGQLNGHVMPAEVKRAAGCVREPVIRVIAISADEIGAWRGEAFASGRGNGAPAVPAEDKGAGLVQH